MSGLIAYHGNAAEKEAILAQLAARRMAGKIRRGVYWDGQKWAVGCTIRSSNYERFGIPQILARIDDRICDELPGSMGDGWPERFMSAIRVGADLSMAWPRFALWLLTDELLQGLTPRARPECAAAIADVGALYREWCDSGENPDRERWGAAAAAADAYTYRAYAAGAAASAGYAAYSVDAGAYAAYSVGYAAWGAADMIKCYRRMADKLIEILQS